MHVRRALLAIVVIAAYFALRSPAPRLSIENPRPVVPALDGGLEIGAPASIEELRRQIAAVMEKEHIPGVSFALVGRDGPIYVGGVGVRDRDQALPADGHTAFRVGSLSKSIVALAVMRLVDQGKLELDRPLRELLPGAVENRWEATHPVTLAQCLEHTAGLDDVRFNEVFTDDEQLSVADTLAINPRSRIVRFPPGTRHAYSNVGYTLAALAVEAATGERFDDYIRREIFTPLGITDADFQRTPILRERLATGYQDGRATEFFPFAHRPSGSLLASAGDLGKLVHFLMVRGEGYPPILSRAAIARIERSGTLPYAPLAADYGFANYGDVWHPARSRGHDGGMPGFHASFRYFPELGVGYTFLLNSNYTFQGYRDLRKLLFAYLTRGQTFPPPPKSAPHDQRPSADYFGFAAPRNAVFGFVELATTGWSATEDGDHVELVQLDGSYARLIPTADGGYRFAFEYGSSIRFTTSDDGTPIMVAGFSYAEAGSNTYARLRYFALGFALVLLHFAPLWAVGVLAYGVYRRAHVLPMSLVLAPAIAGLACKALSVVLFQSFEHGVIGRVHPLTIAFCALTIVLAAASTVTFLSSIRWALRPDRARLRWRLFPLVCGAGAYGFTLWLAFNGLIGLRTWAW